VQLDTRTPGAAPVGFTAWETPPVGFVAQPLTGAAGIIDPNYGLPKIQDIRDGTATSIILYECTGRNEGMDGNTLTNDYYDPYASALAGAPTGRRHWRFGDPDTTSGVSKRINNNAGFGMNITIVSNDNCNGQNWRAHDCGPNNEPFSFHGGGTHFAFADGHVAYVRDSVSIDVLKALATRNNGANEGGLELTD
jgi:prepilin-type processing-associated H-X9-DG protein